MIRDAAQGRWMRGDVVLSRVAVFGTVFAVVLGLCHAAVSGAADRPEGEGGAVVASVHDFTVKGIDGDDVALDRYKGKVLLIVNVASKCGFTRQYEGLQALYERYEDRGFLVLGFPANDFGRQEPGTNAEIRQFCTLNYGVTFPMFAKIAVKGADQHPLYAFLTDKERNPEHGGRITWNFNKFLVDGNGTLIGRFGSRVKPLDERMVAAVEAALAAAAQKP
jgi:glutathione peroxidase